jgi:hypothetical protein
MERAGYSFMIRGYSLTTTDELEEVIMNLKLLGLEGFMMARRLVSFDTLNGENVADIVRLALENPDKARGLEHDSGEESD